MNLTNFFEFFPISHIFKSVLSEVTEIDADQSTADDGGKLLFVISQKGKCQLVHDGYCYVKEKLVKDKVYWRCISYTSKIHCHARIHTIGHSVVRSTPHSHPRDVPSKKFACIQ